MSFADRADDAIRHSAAWITSQRWYGDKARNETSVDPETVVPVNMATLDAALVIVRFSYERGDDSHYFIPLVSSAGTHQPNTGAALDLRDALNDPAFLAWFLTGFDEGRSFEDGGTWEWRTLVESHPPFGMLDYTKARVLAAEQSNTTVVFGNRVVGKVFRRLRRGLNPDLEIGEFLTRQGTFANAPRLYGVVDITHEDDVTAIAAVQEFVPNHGDGWQWMLEQLNRLNPESRDDTLDAVRLLGQRTGELHVALASDTKDEAFAPEPFDDQDARDLNQRVIAEMQDSVEGLAKQISPPEVEAIHKGIGQLMSHAQALVGTAKIRVHGDYHLGQTLRTLENDFCIIDFEGEPSRSIAQRRAKQPALKDVAGMLRSLDYAVATVVGRCHEHEQQEILQAWLPDAQGAFVDAYRKAVQAAPATLIPEDDARFRQGLDLLIAEKALYEVRYELNNRPDWLPIPLNGLRRLVGLPVPEGQYT